MLYALASLFDSFRLDCINNNKNNKKGEEINSDIQRCVLYHLLSFVAVVKWDKTKQKDEEEMNKKKEI